MRRNQAQGDRDAVDGVRELLVIDPHGPDLTIHDRDLVQADRLQGVIDVGCAHALELRDDRFILGLGVRLALHHVLREGRRRTGL